MKKCSVLFAAFAVLLSDVMCAVVAYQFCNLRWAGQCAGASAPESIAFLYAIPFVFGIIGCICFSVFYGKKQK